MTIQLFQGDCIEVMRTLPDGCVDMVLADPPYGTTACKWDSVIPMEPMWEQLSRLTKPNAAIVMTAGQPFSARLVMSNPGEFRHEWIWEKDAGSNFLNVKREPMKEHESVLVFSRGGWIYNRQMEQRVGRRAGRDTRSSRVGQSDCYGGFGVGSFDVGKLRVPRSIQRFARQRGLHPTQKPVALMEYLIRTYTNENDTVLDFTMGSGTTGVACRNTGRSFIGIELDTDYYAIAERRINGEQQTAMAI